jgi:hypothetical protein
VAAKLPSFSKFVDDLLLALAENAVGSFGHLDPNLVAGLGGLEFLPGWVTEAVMRLKEQGFVTLSDRRVASSYIDAGLWVLITGKGAERAEQIRAERGASSGEQEYVPASDRFVTIDHNSTEYKETEEALKATIEAVRGNNEYGESDPDDREQRLAELEAGITLLRPLRVALEKIRSVLLPPLKYLGKKFADNAIGALASAAVGALLLLFHHLL